MANSNSIKFVRPKMTVAARDSIDRLCAEQVKENPNITNRSDAIASVESERNRMLFDIALLESDLTSSRKHIDAVRRVSSYYERSRNSWLSRCGVSVGVNVAMLIYIAYSNNWFM
jgi:hypothetical protein